MNGKSLALVLAGAVAFPGAADLRAQSQRSELARALQQVEQGEFDKALVGLDGIIRTLKAEPNGSKDLAQAYLFQGIAYVGLEQNEKARASFRQALALDKEVTLNRERFAPKIVQVFEEVRQATAPQKKGKTGLILIGVAVAAGGGAAIALSGGGDSVDSGAIPVTEMLTGTLAAGLNDLDCRSNVHRFSMGQAGSVFASSQGGPGGPNLLAFLCVGTAPSPAGSDCAGPVNLALLGAQIRRDMPAGTNSLFLTRSNDCGGTLQYAIQLNHPR
jgi:hypothetical protein